VIAASIERENCQNPPVTANQQQSEAWNGSESVHWVENADRYDRQFEPLTNALFAGLTLSPHQAVLDVGCGCGAVSRRAAREGCSVLGVDISEPLLAVAADRALAESLDGAKFLTADAQTYPFEEGAFDHVISQFGLMFFDQPVTAFANLLHSLTPSGRLTFTCWQGMEANEWVMVLAEAVTQHVTVPSFGGLAGGPGMFALKDPNEIAGLLREGGFTEIGIEPVSSTMLMGGGGTFDESMEFLLGVGIARGLLSQAGPDERVAAMGRIRELLAPRYQPGVGVRLDAAVWLVSASR
jgi:ubiquinone/menaquinone biosynthesis C-methylase UbiE